MAEDTLAMQQEAARRVRDMQERSRQVFEEYQGRTPESLAAARPPLYRKPCAEPPMNRPVPPPAPERGGWLSGLDGEQLLLLGLIVLLLRDGCRPELAIALLYLAMG